MSSQERVLVVEGFDIDAAYTKFLLEKDNWKVDVIQHKKELEGDISLEDYAFVVISSNLKDGSGTDAIRFIRSLENRLETTKNQRTVIIGVNSFSLEQARKSFVEAGVDFYLTKPIYKRNFDVIIDKIKELNMRS